MGKYLDMVRKFEERRQAESQIEPQQVVSPSSSSPWLCPYCGGEAEIEEVCRSLDGERWLTLWCCKPCEVYGVTPEEIQEPPVWVKKTKQ